MTIPAWVQITPMVSLRVLAEPRRLRVLRLSRGRAKTKARPLAGQIHPRAWAGRGRKPAVMA